jgi:hypothetical protein
MGEVITIGLDIAKSVFQVHGVDSSGAVVIRKRVSRLKLLEFFAALPPCLVGIEACPSAHHWGRELQALGHTVRLMPPSYVKAYLKRSKNDANDAAAICEAVTRPSMRFVPVKTKEQQCPCRKPHASGQDARIECPTVNPSGWRVTANRAMLLLDGGSLQTDLVRPCGTVPVAGFSGSGDPGTSSPTQRAAAQIA